MLFFVPCFPFFFGHVALGLCWLCLKLMLKKIEPCWVVAASFSAHVGPMWSHLGLCWDRGGSCCLLYWADVVLSLCGRMLH